MLVMNCHGTILRDVKRLKVYAMNDKWTVYGDDEAFSKEYSSQEEACKALMGFYQSTPLYFYNENKQ